MRATDEAEFKAYAAARMRELRRTAFLLCGDCDAYVRTMLVRATFDRRRKLSWRREVSSAALPEAPSRASGNVEDRLLLFDALAKMPPRQRAVVVLRFWEDLDVAETAAVLDCSQGTVKSQSARGLAKLRELLAPEHLMEGQPQ